MNTENNLPDEETREMISSFVQETLDSLDKAEPLIDDLAHNNNEENVNTIFRVFHTIKGISGFFGFTQLSGLTHEAESLLDLIRKSNRVQSLPTIDLVYENFDLIRNMVFSLNSTYTDSGFEAQISDMKERIKETYNALNRQFNEEPVIAPEPIAQSTIDPTENWPQIDIEMQTEPSKQDDAAQYNNELPEEDDDAYLTPELFQRFVTDSQDSLNHIEHLLLDIDGNPNRKLAVNDMFGRIHSIKGSAGFLHLPEIEKISMQSETMLDNIRSGDLEINQAIVNFLLDQIDETRKLLLKVPTSKIIKTSPNLPVSSIELAENKTQPSGLADNQPPNRATVGDQAAKLADSGVKSRENTSIQRKDIRVDTAKLDKLFDLVGELITIETMISRNPDLEGLELPNFQKAANMLDKVTRELQETTMVMRMTPLEGSFNKMKRLVRDLSQKSKKNIDFVIIGAETEMDKNVIEEISDPLVHIIRNAIDHGIEPSDIRVQKGKSETGSLTLSAGYLGNEIIISVEDDGAGLNRDKILRKAAEKGLLKNPADRMTDAEIFNLIFEPGFSTAEKVTDISGRGVGMDVVRKNIEKLRGSIDIASKPDKGSKISLRIPLTLAILDSMLVQVGDTKYALPILAIKEALRPTDEQITVTMDGLELVKVRDELFPVIRLHEFLNKKPRCTKLSEGILIIVESREGRACLFVDEILGQQQAVIKGLSDFMGKVNGLTGCMILSDGEVGLILDTDLIIKHSGNR